MSRIVVRRRRSCGPVLFLAVVLALAAAGVFAADNAPAPGKALGAGCWLDDGIDDVKALWARGANVEAEEVARDLLARTEYETGPDSLDVAHALTVLVDALRYQDRGREPEALAIAERLVAIRSGILGPDHPDVAKAFVHLSNVMHERAQYARSAELLEAALSIAERSLGPDNVLIGVISNNLGNTLTDLNRRDEARTAFRRALDVERNAYGALDPRVASIVSALGMLEIDEGRFDRAEPLFREALAVHEASDPDSASVARILHNYAIVKFSLGDVQAGIDMMERALAIHERLGGPLSFNVAIGYGDLGTTYMKCGDFARSESYLKRALAIDRSGRPQPGHEAFVLGMLGSDRHQLGDYAEAQRYYLEALALTEKSRGAESMWAGRTLRSLGTVEIHLGDHASAKGHLDRALAVTEKTLGPESLDAAWAHRALGQLADDAEDMAEARSRYARALAIAEKAIGPDAWSLDSLLVNIADLDLREGRAASAEQLLERVLRNDARMFGPDHPHVTEPLSKLAQALAAQGRSAEALDTALRAARIGNEHLRVTAAAFPERRGLVYAGVVRRALGLAVDLAATSGGARPDAVRATWDAVIRDRASVLDEMAARNAAVRPSDDPDTARLVDALARASSRLGNLVMQGPGSMPADTYQALVRAARDDREQAEVGLAQRSASLRDRRAERRATLTDVVPRLGPDDALLAFVRYQSWPVGRSVEGAAAHDAPAGYAAFVAPGDGTAPRVVKLGDAGRIERLVAAWQEQVRLEGLAGGRDPRGGERRYARAATALRIAAWDPVAASFARARRLFIVPDGALSLVAFETLPVGGGRFILDRGPVLHYLATERELVGTAGPRSPAGRGLLAIGNVDYDGVPRLASSAPSGVPERVVFRGARSACARLGSARFEPLPASRSEIAEAEAAWTSTGDRDVLELTGPEASETSFKTLAPGRRVVHVATHGFFLGGPCASSLGAAQNVPAEAEARQIAGENPLVLSGLALAGANGREQRGPDDDDGILTAEEIATLDLSSADWVVLSGCETGAGEPTSGESVLGLRRAFQVAGARTLIMSLWPVGDEPARAWMKELYRHRLADGMDTVSSVREADLDRLRARRAVKASTHPFYWAGFVAIGDWR